MAVVLRRTGPITKRELRDYQFRFRTARSDSERLRILKELDKRIQLARKAAAAAKSN